MNRSDLETGVLPASSLETGGAGWGRRDGGLLDRRLFLGLSALAVTARPALSFAKGKGESKLDLARHERGRVLRAARGYVKEKPVTITASSSPLSAGGKNDFFSQADYWWPDPKNPKGPYIHRDGESNPKNFVQHRLAMRRLSVQMPALTAAWLLTRKKNFADRAADHLRAWFIDSETKMAPHLKYSQAIIGKVTGRRVGVIDTIHLVEVARAADLLETSGALSKSDATGTRAWFEEYLHWLNTHEYGTEERDAKNNHGTCWVQQAAEFGRYTRNAKMTKECRDRFKTILIPNQMAPDGGFPEELRRTKPYGYSLFNLDILGSVAQILSTPNENLWTFELPDGRGMRKGLEFLYPFVADKKKWPKKPDIMYWDEWPIRHPFLVFGGLALEEPKYIALWKKLEGDPKTPEVIRNFPIRQPLLWVDQDLPVV